MILLRRLKIPLLLFAVLFGFSGFRLALRSLKPDNVLRKDFIQEYLMARAARSDVNPYQPLPELNNRFQTNAKWVFAHPTPHTPWLAIFSLPLTFFSYLQAARIWLLVEVLCLVASVFLLLRWLNGSVNPLVMILSAWTALGWSHIWEGLILGQINTILLLLITGAWLNLRNGRQWQGGALLGAAISFKLIFWPLALFLVFRRRWLSVTAALAVFAIINLTAAAIIGWRVVIDYYLHIGPSTAAFYRSCAQNLSLWSVGWRVFSGTGSPEITGITAPAMFLSPRLAVISSLLLTGLALIVCLTVTKSGGSAKVGEGHNFDLSYGIMVCACLLVSPLTWPHYLIIAALPLTLIVSRLRALRFPRLETLLCAITILFLLIPNITLETFIFSFSTAPGSLSGASGIQPDVPVSFAAGLLSLIPTLSVALLIWLMRRLMNETNVGKFPGALTRSS
ncbi:MAG: hypothetical protein JMDDDDMK_02757 [Acidobacteria bacterium]|nr:hypothetical protein [Acidobacteriota bacterium]